MTSKLATAALALGLILSGCGDSNGNVSGSPANLDGPLKQIAAPNNGDWTQVVSATPEGGFRMGNPDAPVKLLEYASITCPHCAEFTEQAGERLQNVYVKSGQVSWEYRPFMIFPSDPGIFMLLRCQGPTPFFRLTDDLYASQADWAGRLQALPPEQLQALENLSPPARAAATVQAAGLDQFFRQRGMPDSRQDSCLADAAGLEALAAVTQRGNADGVTGTPSFFINGENQQAGRWSELEPRLRAAIGG